MKFRSKLLIFFCYLALWTPSAFANLYRIVLDNYSIDSDVSNIEGTMSGFIDIDETIALANTDTYLDTTSNFLFLSNINWITNASLTFTRTGGDGDASYATVTRTLNETESPFLFINWRVTEETALAGGLDFSQDFIGQMQTFGLNNMNEFTGNPSAGVGETNAFVQQFYQSEATLQQPINSVPVPGPLPLLGIAPLAWYYRKLKKKSI